MKSLALLVWLAALLADTKTAEVMDRMRFWEGGVRSYRAIRHNKWRRGKPKRR